MRTAITLLVVLSVPAVLKAGEADLTTPKAVCLSMADALEAGDGAAVRACCAPGQEETEFLATMAEAWATQKAFSSAVADKWRGAGKLDKSWGITLQFEAVVPMAKGIREGIEQREITIHDDEAVVVISRGANRSRTALRKIDGKWRLDFKKTWSAPEGTFRPMTDFYKDMIRVVREILDDMTAGKFATLEEARQAMKAKAQALTPPMRKLVKPATTQPAASQPTTGD